jgi:hypothetical protein
VPGLFSPFCAAIMVDNVEAMERFCGLGSRFAEANAFISVCLGIASMDSAFFRCTLKDLGDLSEEGEAGSGAAISLAHSSTTVVAVDNGGPRGWSWSLLQSSVFEGPNCCAYSRNSECPRLDVVVIPNGRDTDWSDACVSLAVGCVPSKFGDVD